MYASYSKRETKKIRLIHLISAILGAGIIFVINKVCVYPIISGIFIAIICIIVIGRILLMEFSILLGNSE